MMCDIWAWTDWIDYKHAIDMSVWRLICVVVCKYVCPVDFAVNIR